MIEPRALASSHESVDDLVYDERCQNVNTSGLISESNQSHDSIEKIRVDQIHVHRFRARIPFLDLDVCFIGTEATSKGTRSRRKPRSGSSGVAFSIWKMRGRSIG